MLPSWKELELHPLEQARGCFFFFFFFSIHLEVESSQERKTSGSSEVAAEQFVSHPQAPFTHLAPKVVPDTPLRMS